MAFLVKETDLTVIDSSFFTVNTSLLLHALSRKFNCNLQPNLTVNDKPVMVCLVKGTDCNLQLILTVNNSLLWLRKLS